MLCASAPLSSANQEAIVGDEVLYCLLLGLPRYGISFGLKNYAAAYCTGLLCARRLLNKLGLDKTYEGVAKATGEVYHGEEAAAAARPFRALLDVGLVRTTTGARVFGAMKGAVDGGLDIPHTEKRFPGYSRGEGKDTKPSFDPTVLKKRIFGGHVSTYMTEMQEEDPDKFAAHFSEYAKTGKTPADMEKLYAAAHAAIRKNPAHVATTKKAKNTTHLPRARMSRQQKLSRVHQKLASRKSEE